MYASMAPIGTIGTAVLGARITQAVGEANPQLANTGVSSWMMTVVALVAVLVGFALLGVATKQRSR